MFLLGRTDTVHPGSVTSQAWVKAMCDASVPRAECIELLRRAISQQTQSRLESTVGRGCDRHLLALMCAARELGMDMPSIFKDKVSARPKRIALRLYMYVDFLSMAQRLLVNGTSIALQLLVDYIVICAVFSWNNRIKTHAADQSELISRDALSMQFLQPWTMPFQLSTSQAPNMFHEYGCSLDFSVCFGGFGPGSDDGYGVGYCVFGDNRSSCTTSFTYSCK